MPVNKKLYEEMLVRREAEHHEAERVRRWAMVRTCIACAAWCLLGLVCYAFAFHTTDAEWAQIYRISAYIITYGGITFTLARAYVKGEQRGDW